MIEPLACGMDLFSRLFSRRPPAVPADLATAADRELDAILGFWLRNARDPAGGFWSEWRGRPKRRGVRGVLLTSRILWTFSAAYRRRRDPAYLAMAAHAYADLARFRDVEHGGLVWSLDPQQPRRTGRKEIYGQAFGIFGLSEYFRATGEPAALDQAITLYRLIERHARDRGQGGYFDTIEADWSGVRVNGNPGSKSQNTMLHVMEAYTNLLRVWPDPGLRADLAELIELFHARLIDAETKHLRLFFSADLQPMSGIVSPGHDIEFSWLIVEAARAVGDRQLEEKSRALAVAVAAATLPAIGPDGGIPYEIGPAGPLDARRAWWVMAEAAVGFLNAFELSGDPAFRAAAGTCWTYIQRRMIDRRQGEWFARVTPEGQPDRRGPKIGLWKCPYHNGRACMEIAERARRLGLSPA